MLPKTRYMSDKALLNLKNYKYKSGEYSIMDHVFTPFWEYSVNLLPMWLAPNLVTLIGTIVLISGSYYYDLSIDTPLEDKNLYAWSAFAYFFY